MGNTAATGYAVSKTGLTDYVGFQRTLQQAMYMNNIKPWGAMTRMKETLQKQAALAKITPFRYVGVTEGMEYFARQCGGWVIMLNREKFVQMSLQLFAMRGFAVPPAEAKLFYDVFDSIDLYKNATLSIGELAGGMSMFFSGAPDQRARAVFKILSANRSELDKDGLKEFLKPYVWAMVPDMYAALRPILTPYVVDQIFKEITGNTTYNISENQLQYWMYQGSVQNHYPGGSSSALILPDVTGNVVAERAAAHVDMAIDSAYKEYSGRQELRAYGEQTWQTNYHNQPQQLRDVGVARYTGLENILEPNAWRNIGQQATSIGQQAATITSQSVQGLGILYNSLVDGRGRAGSTYSTYSNGSSLYGTQNLVGTTTISGTSTIQPRSPPMATRNVAPTTGYTAQQPGTYATQRPVTFR